MTDKIIYPFTGIIGQQKAKTALLIALVNSKVNGVLLVGDKGCGKSVLVRSCQNLLTNVNLLTVPLNITEDMLFGSIDIEYAVNIGKKRFAPGLLARADNNILYIDEINLLRTDILTALLDITSAGENIVERDGISFTHQVNTLLIGSMNIEEGTLPKHILDRFGLYVCLHSEDEVLDRVKIIKNVLTYENNPVKFCQKYSLEEQKLKEKIIQAKKILKEIKVSEAMLALAAQFCAQGFCAGHRAEIYLVETAKALAALAARTYLLPDDLKTAAEFVLPHRMQTAPQFDKSNNENQDMDTNNLTEQKQDNEKTSDDIKEDTDCNHADIDSSFTNNEQEQQSDEINNNNFATDEKVSEIDKNFSVAEILLDISKDNIIRQGSGKRSLTRTNLKTGRYVRSKLLQDEAIDLALDATIRAAAPWQKIREDNGCAINIQNEDLQQKVREKRIGRTFLFVVDASGSMGAKKRMQAVKGTIFSLLQDAYQKRDKVGLIAFRRKQAELLLPITRSIDLAQKCLTSLPTGGKTPLADGLHLALQILAKLYNNDKDLQPILILITDGRANSSSIADDPVQSALNIAEKISQTKTLTAVIDTETDFIKLGLAKEIAQKMGAAYYTLQNLSQENILHIIRNIER